MAPSQTWTTVAAEYAVRGAVDDALIAAATAAGVGLVQVAPDGSVSWSDEAYRLHGRPRWRRVRSIDDVVWALTADDGARLRSAYWVLTSDPDVEVRYVVRPDPGPARELVLHALDHGVAIVRRAGEPEARPRIVVDVRDTPLAARDDVTRVPDPPPASTSTSTDLASAVLAASPDLVVILDVPGWRVLSVAGSDAESDALVEQLTTDPAHGEPFGRRAIHTEDAERLREWRTGLARLDGDEVRHIDVRFALSDGWRWRELRASAFVRDDAGSVLEAIVLVRDVHERVEASLLLAERERAFREVFDVSPVGLAVVDDQGRFSAVNDAFCRLVGRTRDNVLATVYEALLHHEDRAAAVLSRAKRSTEGGVATATERRLVRSDGTVIWVRMRTSEIAYDHEPRTLMSVEDVTSSKAVEARLRHDALHDQLTGLPNRRLILDRIDRALTRSRRTGSRLALFFIDLDDLKRINDTHPWQHRAGDVLITSVAVAIRETLRDTDTLGRLGGDEFVAICEDIDDDATISELGDRILAAVRRPLVIGSETVGVGASIGVAVPETPDETADQLLGRADSAMYRAKTAGGSRLVRASMEEEAAGNGLDLVSALGRGQLRMHYQPVVSLATGAVLGVEAVARVADPERGLLPVAEVRAALSSGASVLPVVHWSLDRAVADVRTVSPSRAEHLSVWLTLPARAALAGSTRAAIESALGGRDGILDASSAPTLVLGLHEQDVATLMRRHTLLRHLADLVTVGPLGVGVVGFTADTVPLGMLRQLDTVSVTLDPELLATALRDPESEELLRSLVAAASALEVVTIAAGVESHDLLELARRLGVDAVQGDLVGPLAPLEAYSDLLLSGAVALPPAREPIREAVEVPVAPSVTTPVATTVVPIVAAPVAALVAAGSPRLILAGDIGESLARELGLTFPEPVLEATLSAYAPVGDPMPASIAPTVDQQAATAPTAGPFAGFALPPSPFLVLRPRPSE